MWSSCGEPPETFVHVLLLQRLLALVRHRHRHRHGRQLLLPGEVRVRGIPGSRGLASDASDYIFDILYKT